MSLPSSGELSLNRVNQELGRTTTQSVNLNEGLVRTLFGRSSGQISFSDGRGRSCPSNGSYISNYCSGYTLYYRYHNGYCSTYDSVAEYNSTTCGYAAPSGYGYTLNCNGDAWLCTGCGDNDDSAGGLQSYICCPSYTWACAGAYGGGCVSGCTIYIGSCSAYASEYGSYYVGSGCGWQGGCSGGCV